MPAKRRSTAKRKATKVSSKDSAAKRIKKTTVVDDEDDSKTSEQILAAESRIESTPRAEENNTTEKEAAAPTTKTAHENICDRKEDDEQKEKKDDESEKPTEFKYNRVDFEKTSNGNKWNFKIVSWNLNGVRAWLEKDGLDYVRTEDPDVFCMQELKCDKSKIPTEMGVKGYHCYWLSGDTQGYSGVGLMSKQKPISVTFGINDKKHDDEGRVITAEFDKFYLINSYNPNSGRGLVRLGYRMEWEKAFRNYLNELNKKKPVVWCGDLNVAHNEIDLKNPESNRKSAGFTQEERACFTALLSDGYVDSFRHLYPTLIDQYTYWSYMRNSREKNVGWRLDYFVLAKALLPNLVDNMIRPKVIGSDHCPIVLLLNI